MEQALQRTLPTGTHQRHECVFRLAREQKAVAGLADADPSELKSIVRSWHDQAKHLCRASWEETYFDVKEA